MYMAMHCGMLAAFKSLPVLAAAGQLPEEAQAVLMDARSLERLVSLLEIMRRMGLLEPYGKEPGVPERHVLQGLEVRVCINLEP